MSYQVWSWLITACTLLGMHLLEKHDKRGWLVQFGVQGLWIIYALVSKQYGFLAPAPFFIYKYTTGYLAWSREEKTSPSTPTNRDYEQLALALGRYDYDE